MLKQHINNQVMTLTLNRPDVRNAFNAELIGLLTQDIKQAHESDEVRVLVIRGEGKHFSAGADLNWMLGTKDIPMEDNVNDAKALAHLMLSLDACRVPVVTVIQGAAMGGGVGLVSCSDIAIAQTNAVFALSETRLGLSPATISPFVVKAIGARQARRYMLTGETFSATKAYEIGLVHEVCDADQIETTLNETIANLLRGGPFSHRKIKKLVRDVSERPLNDELMENLAWRISNQRISEEGQEGLTAFLEKRSPDWTEKD